MALPPGALGDPVAMEVATGSAEEVERMRLEARSRKRDQSPEPVGTPVVLGPTATGAANPSPMGAGARAGSRGAPRETENEREIKSLEARLNKTDEDAIVWVG